LDGATIPGHFREMEKHKDSTKTKGILPDRLTVVADEQQMLR